MSEITITKRNGEKEQLDLEKMHKVVFFACDGITGVSASEVEIRSHLQFYNEIKTSDIQETLIKAAADLITEETPTTWVAGRLINYLPCKMVYNLTNPVPQKIIDVNIEHGFYDPEIVEKYTAEETHKANSFTFISPDEDTPYVGMEQFLQIPHKIELLVLYMKHQIVYMMIAMTLFVDYPVDTRMRWVKDYYDAISKFIISLPTSLWQVLSSKEVPVQVETDDLISPSHPPQVCIKSGIGIGAGRSHWSHQRRCYTYRCSSATILGGKVQLRVGGGAATLYYPVWHLEVEDSLCLKITKVQKITELDIWTMASLTN